MGFVDLYGFCPFFFFFLVLSGADALNLKVLLICTGVISLQFQTSILHGLEKNVLVVGTKVSSVLTLDSETGNMLTTSRVQPKKPSKALFMQSLGKCYWLQVSFLAAIKNLSYMLISLSITSLMIS